MCHACSDEIEHDSVARWKMFNYRTSGNTGAQYDWLQRHGEKCCLFLFWFVFVQRVPESDKYERQSADCHSPLQKLNLQTCTWDCPTTTDVTASPHMLPYQYVAICHLCFTAVAKAHKTIKNNGSLKYFPNVFWKVSAPAKYWDLKVTSIQNLIYYIRSHTCTLCGTFSFPLHHLGI